MYLPIAMKAFGIPYAKTVFNHIFINAPAGYAVGEDDAIFGIPDKILEPFRNGSFGRFMVFPGNGISYMGSIDGLIEDINYGLQHRQQPDAKYVMLYLWLRGRWKDRVVLFEYGEKD